MKYPPQEPFFGCPNQNVHFIKMIVQQLDLYVISNFFGVYF